jgi:hypothetical protein
VVLNNPIDTVEERNNLTTLTVLTGTPSDMNALINSLNAFVASNPPLVESKEIIDKYQLLSPDPSNGWYCEGTGLGNGSHDLSGNYSINYSFKPGITYKMSIYERIWAADRQGVVNVYGYHDCIPPVSADYRLRYDDVIVTGSAVCGNGAVEAGEQCEPPNTPTCNASCQTIAPGPGPGPSTDILVQVTGINQCGSHNEDICVLQANVTSNRTETKYVLFRDGSGNLIGKGTNIVGSNDGVSELVLDKCLKGEENGDPKTYNITAVPYIVFN